MMLDTLAIPFVKEQNIKDRIQGFFIWLLVLFIAILLVGSWFASLIGIIKQRKEDYNPDSYTSNLLKEGMPKIAQKIVEEAGELSIASLTDKNSSKIIHEFSDLIYHMLVMLEKADINIEEIWDELELRKK